MLKVLKYVFAIGLTLISMHFDVIDIQIAVCVAILGVMAVAFLFVEVVKQIVSDIKLMLQCSRKPKE